MAPLRLLAALAGLAASSLAGSGSGLGLPNEGKVHFGVWLDADVEPVDWNAAMGKNASSFQFAQNLPFDPYDYSTGTGGLMNQTLIENTGTNASIFLTVYPQTLLNQTNATDLQLLGEQILFYQSAPYNRTVFLRYAPEMQGNWEPYGRSPSSFVAGWQTMYAAIKAAAPDTIIVWSPNTQEGYPYGYALSSFSAADQALLDTNGDGSLTIEDDAFAPYYPGDDYVDWVGISFYEKGTYPYDTNTEQTSETLVAAMLGNNSALSYVTPWYSTYCTASTPCVISEAGAAFHANASSGAGPGQLALEENWWTQGWTNASFYDQFPEIKMIQLFEFEKAETDDSIGDIRDYRITYNATLRAQFLADLDASVPNLYDWSEYKVIYDGNDGTAEPVASEAASYPAGYTATADSGSGSAAKSTGTAGAAQSTSPSLFGAGARVGGGAGGAWLAAVAGAVGCVALGAGVVW